LPLADCGRLRYGPIVVIACRPLAIFVFLGLGIVSASEQEDSFAPPPFDVALFAPESLGEIDAIFGVLAEPIPEIWISNLAASLRDFQIERFQEDALRLTVIADDFGAFHPAGAVLSDHEPGVAALVSGLIPWMDRRPGDSLLAQLGDGHDRWKVKVKPGPVPTVSLRAHW